MVGSTPRGAAGPPDGSPGSSAGAPDGLPEGGAGGVRDVGDVPVDGAMGTDGAAPGGSAEGDPRLRGPSLSPSRAADFKACPLRHRFRTVDRLPEPPSVDALRGTVVHKVLEDLFDLPAAERTPGRASGMVEDAWHEVQELAHEEIGDVAVFDDPGQEADWLASCRAVLARWFDLEDPRRLQPEARELYVEVEVGPEDEPLVLRGVIDRLDVAPDGAVRVVDYKTGRSPAPGFEAGALFQMRFYALVLWRTRGVVPRQLQLVYLGDGDVVRYEPDEDELRATERQVRAIAEALATAHRTGDWQPNPGARCGWCSFKDLCPAHGGTPPPLPPPADERAGESPATPGEMPGETLGTPAQASSVAAEPPPDVSSPGAPEVPSTRSG